MSFLANPQYRKYLADSQAAALLLKAADAEGFAGNALVVPDPYLAYARVSHLFDPKPKAASRDSSDGGDGGGCGGRSGGEYRCLCGDRKRVRALLPV